MSLIPQYYNKFAKPVFKGWVSVITMVNYICIIIRTLLVTLIMLSVGLNPSNTK